jgi:hypothetical protein
MEDNSMLDDILNEQKFGELDLDDFSEPEDLHTEDVEAARSDRKLVRDPNYIPSNEV